MTILHIIAQTANAFFWAFAGIYLAVIADSRQRYWPFAGAIVCTVIALCVACQFGVDMGRILQEGGQ